MTEIRVIHEAAAISCLDQIGDEEAAQICRKIDGGRRFVLALGARDPRKNTRRIIEAFASFLRSRSCRLQLVVVGVRGADAVRFRAIARSAGISDRVEFLEFVSDRMLAALYRRADAFLYPSLYEGFGLPLVEAMSAGVPIVTSPRGAIPEIAGDAVVMADPLDSEAIAAALGRVISDEGLRRTMMTRGRLRAADFSWERAAREYVSIYEEAGRG